jgi:hypothetical protein
MGELCVSAMSARLAATQKCPFATSNWIPNAIEPLMAYQRSVRRTKVAITSGHVGH